jgi:hypothetical protein
MMERLTEKIVGKFGPHDHPAAADLTQRQPDDLARRLVEVRRLHAGSFLLSTIRCQVRSTSDEMAISGLSEFRAKFSERTLDAGSTPRDPATKDHPRCRNEPIRAVMALGREGFARIRRLQ